METVRDMGPRLGIAPTCSALGLPRATFYRSLRPAKVRAARALPKHALSPAERQAVLATLHEDRFVDLAPTEIYAQLLDEGKHLCSIRTMYRVLAAAEEVRERRRQRLHPPYAKPELLATAPNQVWSWDITKLLGPATWTYFYLYVLLDVFSRYVVGWLVAEKESAALARRLVAESCARQNSRRASSLFTPTAAAPCGRRRSHRRWRAWASRRVTRGPTSRTTTRSPRPSSKRSSTGPTFRSGSILCATP